MNAPQLKYEGWFYGLAFLLALGLRLVQLGAPPLTDSEATLALQALHIVNGTRPLLGPQPAYILLTSVLFLIFESTNFLARIVPAIVGSTMVFAPMLFREKLRPRPALILAFLFAIDPGFVALSRLAGGVVLAVTFTLFAWGMWNHRRFVPAGIFAGLALLSGTSIWMGLLGLGLAWLFIRGVERKPLTEGPEDSDIPVFDPDSSGEQIDKPQLPVTNYEIRPLALALVATLILAGTLFFTVPSGLSAWVSSLPAFLVGWVTSAVMTPGRMLFTLFVYEPLGLFFAILSLIRGFRTGKPAHYPSKHLAGGVAAAGGLLPAGG